MESLMDLQKFDNVYDDFYFHINKTLQIITGLWPYRTRADNAPQRLIVYTFLFAMMLPQVTFCLILLNYYLLNCESILNNLSLLLIESDEKIIFFFFFFLEIILLYLQLRCYGCIGYKTKIMTRSSKFDSH